MKLNVLMPFLAEEITQGLSDMGKPKLARSIEELEIVGRCDCDNAGCAAFYTDEKHNWSGKEIKHVTPNVKGLFSIDVHNDKIIFVEMMGRQDVRERLLAVHP